MTAGWRYLETYSKTVLFTRCCGWLSPAVLTLSIPPLPSRSSSCCSDRGEGKGLAEEQRRGSDVQKCSDGGTFSSSEKKQLISLCLSQRISMERIRLVLLLDPHYSFHFWTLCQSSCLFQEGLSYGTDYSDSVPYSYSLVFPVIQNEITRKAAIIKAATKREMLTKQIIAKALYSTSLFHSLRCSSVTASFFTPLTAAVQPAGITRGQDSLHTFAHLHGHPWSPDVQRAPLEALSRAASPSSPSSGCTPTQSVQKRSEMK